MWDGSAWRYYRYGDCINSLTAGHWGYRDKDFYENSTYPNAVGGQGSIIRLWACTYYCTDTWIDVVNDQ